MKFLDRIFAPKKKDTEKEIEIEELISIMDPEDQTDYYKPKKKNISHDENSPNDKHVVQISDELFKAGELIIATNRPSVGLIQRQLETTFSQALCIMNQLVELGVVTGEETGEPRKVLMNMDEYIDKMRHIQEQENVQKEFFKDAKAGLTDVDLMNGIEFERWCATLLKLNGFTNVNLTKASNDQAFIYKKSIPTVCARTKRWTA